MHALTTRAEAAAADLPDVGIGLAVCKRIIDAHDGRIWAGPREGGGAELGFALPLSGDLDELEIG